MANCGKPFAILRITHDVATQIDANEKSPEPCKQILNFLPLSSAFSAMHIKKAPLSRSLLGSTYSVKPKVTIKRCRSVFGQSICFANGNARHFAAQNWLRQPLFGGCIAAPFSSGCSAVFSARGQSICYANGYAAPFSSGCSTKTATKKEDSFRSPQIYLFS